MERLADFRPHDSFKGLGRSRGSGRLSHVRGREGPARGVGGGGGRVGGGCFADPKWSPRFCLGMDGLAAGG